MYCVKTSSERYKNYFKVQLKTSEGHLAVVYGLHLVLEAFQCSAVNSRLWKVVPEANTIWKEGLLVYHGPGVGY